MTILLPVLCGPVLCKHVNWNNIFYQFKNETSLPNVTLPWCIHANIWNESIIFLIEYTLNQFMKEKSTKCLEYE